MKSKQMKTVALCSQKGGPGKTMLSLNLGVAAMRAGHTVLIIDLDPQASAAKWGDRRENEPPVVISAHASRLKNALEAAEENGVTLCIIDTPPNAESAVRDAAKAADLCLIPCRPGMFDVEAMEATIEIGKIANVEMRVVMNAVSPRSSMLDLAREAVEVYKVPCAPCVIGDRVVFSKAVVDGQAVQEFKPKDEKALDEIHSLYRYVCQEMGV